MQAERIGYCHGVSPSWKVMRERGRCRVDLRVLVAFPGFNGSFTKLNLTRG
ncbi:hypothetical protein GLE_3158 [Lysobacter enzymogenes]|uniref:Uncharacterized protein n=1 Tax=Lysobacter enzymogenes TaxID=69 RepID=A0A0S2DJP7_LYSEN|nr:hypothetical protein GLE_3158 [Lysobacter enzymogenes]